jgi:hypothetical protein
VSLLFYPFLGLISVLLILFAWSVRKPAKRATTPSLASLARLLEACERKHATYFPQIRQAFAKTDDEFLRQRGSRELARKVRRERHHVAMAYLKSLRADFQNLLKLAKMVAALSPAVVAVEEWERLRLTLKFFWQYEIIRFELQAGFAPLPQLSGLANVVSGLSVRMENAIRELGERAAMASQFASTLDGRGVDPTYN